jgi:membrane protease YdiL (CAAX protease family)
LNKTIRNIGIFVFASFSCGWLGLLVDKLINTQQNGESLGMGIWLVFPLLATIFLRLFAGDGWKDIGLKPNFKGNIKSYIISLLIYPIVTAIVLFIGKIFGWINFSNFRTEAYFSGFFGLLIVNFIKNFFEESVWRGYLTAKILKTKIKDIWLYLIVGGVWGIWHLPYYLFFLPSSDMYQVLPVGRFLFAIVAIISMICWTLMFVELYRKTKSIWAVVLLHMVEDSLVNHLVIDGHITIVSGKEILISPICGIITSILYVGVGLSLRHNRIKNECKKAKPAHNRTVYASPLERLGLHSSSVLSNTDSGI